MSSIIVTGGSGNLGQAVITRFKREGYNIISVAKQAHTQGKNEITPVDFHEVDLVNETASESFVQAVIDKYESIDIAVLTAGGFDMGTLENTTAADVRRMYDLNFQTTYNVARPVFLQMMKQGRGRIFFIGAKAGLQPGSFKETIAYGLSKSLLFSLAEMMNSTALGRNVVSSVIVPSIIDTPQNRKSMPGADHAQWVSPEAIADIIYYYSSKEAELIRNPVIRVYGNV